MVFCKTKDEIRRLCFHKGKVVKAEILHFVQNDRKNATSLKDFMIKVEMRSIGQNLKSFVVKVKTLRYAQGDRKNIEWQKGGHPRASVSERRISFL